MLHHYDYLKCLQGPHATQSSYTRVIESHEVTQFVYFEVSTMLAGLEFR